MIDGQGDGNTTVSILAIDLLPGLEFGYMNGGTFTGSSNVFTLANFEGGTIIDFAIHDTASGTTMEASSGNATMEFWGSIAAGNSEKPIVGFDYWRGVNIWWTQDWIPDDILISVSSDTDGIAPAHSHRFQPRLRKQRARCLHHVSSWPRTFSTRSYWKEEKQKISFIPIFWTIIGGANGSAFYLNHSYITVFSMVPEAAVQ